MALPYGRTLLIAALLVALLVFSLTGARLAVWEALWPMIEWMESSWFGQAGKTWGGLFAVVQAGHLLGLALLGGSVLLGEGQLLGLWFKGAGEEVQRQAHRGMLAALFALVATGAFMVCAVAVKVYYLEVFWYKMLGLGFGVVFALGVRRPFVQAGLQIEYPTVARCVAVASLMIWFTVAATGRWIGFSG